MYVRVCNVKVSVLLVGHVPTALVRAGGTHKDRGTHVKARLNWFTYLVLLLPFHCEMCETQVTSSDLSPGVLSHLYQHCIGYFTNSIVRSI